MTFRQGDKVLRIEQLYPPVVRINGKLISLETEPKNEVEAKIIEVLREFYNKRNPYGRSLIAYELALFERLQAILEEV